VEQKVHTIVIKDLPKGEYAISVFQDEDFDKECNIGFLGFPKENYGFSNNYRPRFRAPYLMTVN